MGHRQRPVTLLGGDVRQRHVGAAGTGRHRRQCDRLLERHPGVVGLAGRAQRATKRHLDREAVRVFLDQLAQRREPVVPPRLGQPLVRPLHRPPERAEADLDRDVKRRLQRVEVEPDPLERRLGLEPVAVGAE